MELTAYRSFSKRKNSTKRPSGGSTRSVVLLDDTSLYEPVFKCNYWDYNDTYVKWVGRYYYVTDVVCVRRDIFEVHCQIDAIATWKDDILNTNAFVCFSSSSYDVGIPDYRLSSDPITISKFSHTSVFPGLAESFVTTYIGQNAVPSVGLTYSLLESLQGKVMSNQFFSTLSGWMDNFVTKGNQSTEWSNLMPSVINSTADTITSCIYMPKFKSNGGSNDIVLAGGFETNIVGEVPSHSYSETYSCSIPWAFGNGDFRNRAEFTALAIYLPGYGFIALNADNYQGQSSISVQATLDSYVGEITYLVGGKAKATCSISYPVQVGTSQKGNALGAITGMAQTVGGIATGSISSTAQGVFNTARSVIGVDPSSVGSMGGSSAFNCHDKITVVVMAHNTNVEPSSVGSTVGRPLNAVRRIGSLSGYVQCSNAIVSSSAPEPYKTELNEILNGGMYIE